MSHVLSPLLYKIHTIKPVTLVQTVADRGRDKAIFFIGTIVALVFTQTLKLR